MNEIKHLLALYTDYSQSESQNGIIRSLTEPVEYIMQLPGKKIRPLLCLLGYSRYHALLNNVLPAAHAIELFHNFTLMHDDIMDEADLRRGQPTVHLKYNTSQAILSGDAMLILAYQYLLQATDVAQARDLGSLFSKVALDICIGQQMDMNFEKERSVTTDEYLEMIRLKTAVLLGASLQIGALLGGGPKEECLQLYQYGVTLGVAFQMQDDYMDLFGNPDQIGKINGGDILRNKKTYLICRAMQLASPDQQTELMHFLNNENVLPDEKIANIKGLFETLGLNEIVTSEIEERFVLAESILQAIPDPNGHNHTLANLAAQIKERRK